ncbi:MAG: beta-propeller domain-containing protein, partial [Gammaproteobacteria bacterium]|nr:beta-propeller domain-containing protein [Gammaproteobacteria bacterium]
TEIDGQHITSRRIDNRLYLVTRYSPTIPGYIVPAFDPQVIDNNELLLSNVTLGDLMPDIHYDNGVDAELLNASDCYITNSSNGTNLYADLIALTVLNLDTQAAENSRCFIGATEAVYVSQQAAYLATSQYNYSINTGGALLYSNGYHTGIHKFSLQGATAVYQGSEQVEGHLGWEQDKKSFRMGEQGEHLIVATSLGETWDNTATTRLTVIKDDPVNGFATVNTLPNDSHPEKIGKPGEKLYSVRIMDGVAYLVTFRVTDPLYVIDLHNPADPFIAGELQIQGYSDYLHPLEGGLLLGVGKDAVADSSDGDNATGAWYQGIKLSLFDVNNWSNPVELNSIVIGKRGSESAVLHDHHAFTILPGNGMDVPTRIAVPVDMHDTVPPYFTGALWEWYGWTHTALYLFELDTGAGLPQLMQTGNIVAESNNGVSYYASGHRDRSVLSGAGAYYIHNQKVWSAPYQSLSQVDGPK